VRGYDAAIERDLRRFLVFTVILSAAKDDINAAWPQTDGSGNLKCASELPRRPAQLPPTQHVQVQMVHALSGVPPRVRHNPISPSV
jgi:hypothetical protein